ncbi:hypothetical protein [Antarcticirhabdus aurantiaca]|uniref:Uncharacterized protein n=1 Tax=Antarcticirhabdus aurantiaca TaxID=2606717 RepID=A0ACD4NQD4_9HYPH|nr:hypothetical protein [Antarcticirhabdus aurantiaca]WAJ28937.1 hypothetical protein OXU80_01390 [Jeongeuplla avenae]
MPTLTIEGRSVTVGDEFLSMSPEQQNAAVEEIGRSLGLAPAGGEESPAMKDALASASRRSRQFFGENSGPPPGEYGGTAMNSTAGVNEGMYGLAGLPVDVMAGAMNAGIRGVNYVTGAELPTIDNPVGGSRSIAAAAGSLHPALDPANTRARTAEERYARAAGVGVGGSVAGAGVVGALSRAGALSAPMAQTGAALLGRSSSAGVVAGEAAVSGAASAGASAAADAAPDQLKPVAALAGGLLAGGTAATAAGVPGAIRGSAQAGGRALAPLTQAGRERLAADRLRAGATDPAALRAALDEGSAELVPGSMPTTGQATGDMGILAAERGAATRRPELFQQRAADQNAARLDALQGVQPGGAPEAVTAAIRQRLDLIDRTTQSGLDAAQGSARASVEALGPGMVPEATGDAVRGSYEAARAAAKAEENRLWEAVDPDGFLVAPVVNVRQAAADIIANASRFVDLSEREAGIYRAVADLDDTMPFSEVTDLRSMLGDALREERRTKGETQTYGRLSKVRGALERDLDEAISSKVAQEAEAVAVGRMSFEDTIAAKLQSRQESYVGGRQAVARSAGSAAGPGNYASGRMATVPGIRGAGGETRRGSGSSSGNPGLASGQPASPNFDEAARERLSAATTATRNRAQTFDNRTLAPMRRRPSTTASYDMPSAAVIGRLFFPGPKSPEALATFRQAVQTPEAMQAVEAYAVDRLRKAALREDGTLDPAKVATWRRSHADALRTLPELDARFADAARTSEMMANVARGRKRALDEAQAGALGRLLGAEDPGTVSNMIGGILSRQDGVEQIRGIRAAIGDDKEARQGLRKAVADHITSRLVGNTEAATSGRQTIRSDQFQTFVRRNVEALRAAGFSDDEVKLMQDIAADLQRSNRSAAAVRIPGQSNTAQDMLAAGRDAGMSVLQRIVLGGSTAAGGVLYSGSITGAALGLVPELMAKARQAGLAKVDDIVTDALLNPGRARLLLSRPSSRKVEGQTMRLLGQLYSRAGTASSGEAVEERRERQGGVHAR